MQVFEWSTTVPSHKSPSHLAFFPQEKCISWCMCWAGFSCMDFIGIYWSAKSKSKPREWYLILLWNLGDQWLARWPKESLFTPLSLHFPIWRRTAAIFADVKCATCNWVLSSSETNVTNGMLCDKQLPRPHIGSTRVGLCGNCENAAHDRNHVWAAAG